MNLIDITPVIVAVTAAIGAAVTAILIPYVRAQIGEVKSAQLAGTVAVFVRAAEQLYGAGHGAEKLQYVADGLAKSGVKVDVGDTADAVRAMIEAAVLGLKS